MVLMRFFFGGADTPSDSSRSKYSTLVGDDMMAVSAAAWPTVPLSGGTVQAAAAAAAGGELKKQGRNRKAKKSELRRVPRRTTDRS